jgi:hypothetical protein
MKNWRKSLKSMKDNILSRKRKTKKKALWVRILFCQQSIYKLSYQVLQEKCQFPIINPKLIRITSQSVS